MLLLRSVFVPAVDTAPSADLERFCPARHQSLPGSAARVRVYHGGDERFPWSRRPRGEWQSYVVGPSPKSPQSPQANVRICEH
jgi:hypothetical protein